MQFYRKYIYNLSFIKYINFIFLLLSCYQGMAQPMTWEWAKNAGYISDEFAAGDDCLNIYDNCTDSQGNMCITGVFHGVIDFGPFELQQNDCGTYDNCFTAKYNPLGGILWSHKIEYSASSWGWASPRVVFSDSHNNVYVTGIFEGLIKVDNQTLLASGSDDIFLIKYKPDGVLSWIKKIGGQGLDEIKKNCAFIDIYDNIFISGNFRSSYLNFGNISITNASANADIFIARIDTNGVYIWADRIGGTGTENVDCIGGNESRLILSGETNNTGFLVDNFAVLTDRFLTSFDVTGFPVWVKNFPGSVFKGFSIKTDNSQNIYLAADFGGIVTVDNLTFNSGSTFSGNIFIVKLSSSGQAICGNSLLLYPQYYSYFYDVEVDNQANVYVETPFINISFDSVTINSNNCNIVVVKYDSTLEYKSYLRTKTDLYSFNSCFSIDPGNNLYMVGEYFGNYLVAGEDSLVSGTSPEIWFGNIFLSKINSSGSGIDYQRIILQQGWSIISSYIEPYEPDMNLIFDNNISNIQIVKNDMGQVFWPIFGVNSIVDYNVLDGYQVKLTSSDTLTIEGVPVLPEFTPLILNTDWHLISYLRQTPAPISNMLGVVNSYIIIVKNSNGLVFWPYYNINLIGDMIPGQGYQIRLNTPVSLYYPAN